MRRTGSESSSEFWDSYSRRYERLLLLRPYLAMVRDIVAAVGEPSEGPVLDAGCGVGLITVALSDAGHSVIALDASSQALLRVGARCPDAKIVEQDLVLPLPFSDASIWSIVCSNVLYAIPPNMRMNVMLEFARVLCAGGRLDLVNPLADSRQERVLARHLQLVFESDGLFAMIRDAAGVIPQMLVLAVQNVRINRVLRRGEYRLLMSGEQTRLIERAGLHPVLATRTYGDQAELAVGVKSIRV